MSEAMFQDNPAYLESVNLLHRLHELMRDGKDDEEGDRVREAMEAPWYKLSDEEQDRLGAISADLKTLEPASPIRHVEGPRYIEESMFQALAPLTLAGEWEQVLRLLRESPEKVSWDVAARYRAEAYAKLGEGATAERFLAEAWRLNPKLPDLAFVDAGIRGTLVSNG